MKKTKYLLLLVLVLPALFVGGYLIGNTGTDAGTTVSGKDVAVHGSALLECFNDEPCVRVQDYNLITNMGLEEIANKIFNDANSSAANFDYIALGNGTSPVAGSATLNSEIADCGLQRAQGTVRSVGTGNKTVTYTFTSTCDSVIVNNTMLFNASSSGTPYAGGPLSTNRTMMADDTLNITVFSWFVNP